MKVLFVICLIASLAFCFTFFNNESDSTDNLSSSIYDYSAHLIDGSKIDFIDFKGKKIMIVNVASKCGYTPQYNGLQEIHEKYKDLL